jgi:hypothetical protein
VLCVKLLPLGIEAVMTEESKTRFPALAIHFCCVWALAYDLANVHEVQLTSNTHYVQFSRICVLGSVPSREEYFCLSKCHGSSMPLIWVHGSLGHPHA